MKKVLGGLWQVVCILIMFGIGIWFFVWLSNEDSGNSTSNPVDQYEDPHTNTSRYR